MKKIKNDGAFICWVLGKGVWEISRKVYKMTRKCQEICFIINLGHNLSFHSWSGNSLQDTREWTKRHLRPFQLEFCQENSGEGLGASRSILKAGEMEVKENPYRLSGSVDVKEAQEAGRAQVNECRKPKKLPPPGWLPLLPQVRDGCCLFRLGNPQAWGWCLSWGIVRSRLAKDFGQWSISPSKGRKEGWCLICKVSPARDLLLSDKGVLEQKDAESWIMRALKSSLECRKLAFPEPSRTSQFPVLWEREKCSFRGHSE